MAISRGYSKGYNGHMESSRCHKGKFYLSSFSLLCNTLYKCHCTSFYFLSLSLSEVLFSYVLQISKDEITHLIDAGDPCDDDDVKKKLFHPTLKLLIVTSGSKGCRYYTNDFKGEVRGLNVEPVDTTGAGDAFVSGILYYIASDPSIFKDEKRLRKVLYFASVCGAIMVTKRGAISALPTKDDILQYKMQ